MSIIRKSIQTDSIEFHNNSNPVSFATTNNLYFESSTLSFDDKTIAFRNTYNNFSSLNTINNLFVNTANIGSSILSNATINTSNLVNSTLITPFISNSATVGYNSGSAQLTLLGTGGSSFSIVNETDNDIRFQNSNTNGWFNFQASGGGFQVRPIPSYENAFVVGHFNSGSTFIVDTTNLRTHIRNGQFLVHTNGSASLPNIAFTGDNNTGIYSSTTDTIDFSTNGVRAFTIGKTGINASIPIFDSVLSSPTISNLVLNGATLNTGILNSPTISNLVLNSATLNTGILNSPTISNLVLNGATLNTSNINSPTISNLVLNGATLNTSILNSPTISNLVLSSATLSNPYINTGIGILTTSSITSSAISSSTLSNPFITNASINSAVITNQTSTSISLAYNNSASQITLNSTGSSCSIYKDADGDIQFDNNNNGWYAFTTSAGGFAIKSNPPSVNCFNIRGSEGSILFNYDSTNLRTTIVRGQFLVHTNGSPSLPCIAFTGDNNTGIYSSTTDTIDFSTNGVRAFTIGKTGVNSALPIFDSVLSSPTISNLVLNGATLNTSNLNSPTISNLVLNGATLNTSNINSPTISNLVLNGATLNTSVLNSPTISNLVLSSATLNTSVLNNSTINTPKVILALSNSTTPSVCFSGDTNTGIYSRGVKDVSFSANGNLRFFVGQTQSGFVGTDTFWNTLGATRGSYMAPLIFSSFNQTLNSAAGSLNPSVPTIYVKQSSLHKGTGATFSAVSTLYLEPPLLSSPSTVVSGSTVTYTGLHIPSMPMKTSGGWPVFSAATIEAPSGADMNFAIRNVGVSSFEYAGYSTSPNICFDRDNVDYGIYSNTRDQIGFTTSGNTRALITNTSLNVSLPLICDNTSSWTTFNQTGNSSGAITSSHTTNTSIVGSVVNFTWSQLGTATAGSASKIVFNTTIPSNYRPSASKYFYVHGHNNGANSSVILEVDSGGNITAGVAPGNTTFTNGASCGVFSGSLSYRLGL